MNTFRQHIEKITPITDEEFDYIFSMFSIKMQCFLVLQTG